MELLQCGGRIQAEPQIGQWRWGLRIGIEQPIDQRLQTDAQDNEHMVTREELA